MFPVAMSSPAGGAIGPFPRRPESGQTAQDFYQATLEVQLAIYNGVILTWREKVSSVCTGNAGGLSRKLSVPPPVVG